MPAPGSIVAIAGPSCSGKTELARRLAADLGASILPVDAYYRDLSHLTPPARSEVNFDAPAAIETELLLRDLRRLAAGSPVKRPIYDFHTHTRQPRGKKVPATGFLILEGLFALYWPEVRELSTTRVFVELDDRICLERRLERDTRERGRTPESVRRQWEQTVRPMAERYVLPCRRFADIVVSGAAPTAVSAAKVRAHLRAGL